VRGGRLQLRKLCRAEHLLAGGPLERAYVAEQAEQRRAEDLRVDRGDRVEIAQRGGGQRR